MIPVSYDEDIDKVISEMEDMTSGLKKALPYIIDDAKVLGVDMLDASSINIKIIAPCTPSMQYQCKRDILRHVRAEMARRGLEIPYSHITVINK